MQRRVDIYLRNCRASKQLAFDSVLAGPEISHVEYIHIED